MSALQALLATFTLPQTERFAHSPLSECRVNARTTETFLQRVLTYPAATVTDRGATVINDRAVRPGVARPD